MSVYEWLIVPHGDSKERKVDLQRYLQEKVHHIFIHED